MAKVQILIRLDPSKPVDAATIAALQAADGGDGVNATAKRMLQVFREEAVRNPAVNQNLVGQVLPSMPSAPAVPESTGFAGAIEIDFSAL